MRLTLRRFLIALMLSVTTPLLPQTADKHLADSLRPLVDSYFGKSAQEISDHQIASKQLEIAKKAAERLPANKTNTALKIKTRIALGSVYTNMMMFPQAYTNLQEGLELNKSLGDTRLQFKLENSLLVIYRFLNLNEEIISICKKSLTKPEYSDYNKYFLLYNIAACYTDMRIFDSAEMYLDTALIYAQTVRDSALIPYYRGAIGIEKHQYDLALQNFNESFNEINGKGHEDVEANILVYKGLAFSRLKMYDSAMRCVDTGISHALRNNYLYIEERGLEIKQDILYETKDYEAYAEVSRQFKNIRDSLEKAENVERLQQLEFDRQFAVAKEQMTQAQLVKDMKHQRQRLILYLIIVILIFGISIVFLLLNRNRIILKNKKIQEEAMSRELDLRNRELTAKALVQTQRQEILTDIIDKLVAIQGDKNKLSENIQGVIHDFKQYRNAQTPEDFDYYFTQTHPDFYRNLQKDYPELTPHEMHLCAYIRLNLNTKDIAQISGIEPSSVRMARHRLRKSLGIANSDIDLTKFLSKY